MNGLAELWHIVRKDVRQSRWLLAAYAALVVAATAGAMSRETLLDGKLQWAAGLLLILGPITAASIIHADSPTQADAFWASHPFRWWAILGAKLTLVIGFLHVVPLVGQFLGLMAFKVPASERATMMLISAVSYGLALLVAVFLGALTRDLRGFILGIIAFFVAMMATSIVLSELQWSWNASLRSVLQFLAFAGIVVVFVTLYLRRDVRGVRVAGIAALALLLVASVQPAGQAASRSPIDATMQTAPRSVIAMELRDTGQISRSGRVQLRLKVVEGANGLHYRIDDARARFFVHNGATLELPIRQFMSGTLGSGPLALPGVQTLREVEDQFVNPLTDVLVELSDDERSTLAQGLDSAQVAGTLTVLEPRVMTTLPLRAGASALVDGNEVSIERIAFRSSRDVVELAVKTVTGASDEYAWMDYENGFLAVVVNPARSEGIGLGRGRASGNPGLLVLPGAGLRQGTVTYRRPTPPRGQQIPIDDAFLQGGELMIVRWEPTASYRMQLSSVPLQVAPITDRAGNSRSRM